MPYVGSYIWKIRQKVGHDLLLSPTVDTIPVDEKGRLMLVYNREHKAWSFAGGQVEVGEDWRGSAAKELFEECGLRAELNDLIPFAMISGRGYMWNYSNGDKIQAFSTCFVAKKWEDSGAIEDKEEIEERRWFDVSEIEKMDLTLSTKYLLPAYKNWLQTGEFQVIDVNSGSGQDNR
jgi:ADP-ribose pyrophosphatase